MLSRRLILFLDQDGTEKDLSDFKRGFPVRARTAGAPVTKSARVVLVSKRTVNWPTVHPKGINQLEKINMFF